MTKRILPVLFLCLAACDQSGSGGSGGGGALTPTPTAAPVTNAPQFNNTALPSCAPVVGTHWVLSGEPQLEPISQDQQGQTPYIEEFDLTPQDPTFTENQYVAGFGTLTCTRHFNDAVQNGSSLYWPTASGECSSVSEWLVFDTSVCNQLTVTIMYGTPNTENGVYETAIYTAN